MRTTGILARRYVAEPAALGAVPVPHGHGGLVLGRLQDGSPALVRLFRPTPNRVGLVGGWPVARLLVFRALALGVRVIVQTVAPQQWQGLGEWATGRPDRLIVVPGGGAVGGPTAEATQPVLHLLDLGTDAAGTATVQEPWRTRLTLLHELTGPATAGLAGAELCLFRRLTPAEAAVAARLRLPHGTAELLGMLNRDMLAAVDRDGARYVWLSATAAEQQSLGLTGQ